MRDIKRKENNLNTLKFYCWPSRSEDENFQIRNKKSEYLDSTRSRDVIVYVLM